MSELRALGARAQADCRDEARVRKHRETGIYYLRHMHGYPTDIGKFVELGRAQGLDDVANRILATLDEATGKQHSAMSPAVPCSVLTNNWPVMYEKVVEPYFRFRGGPSAHVRVVHD
jgi:hypothetical protein